jgi:hypothetical protein
MRGIASAVRHDGTLTRTQSSVLGAVGKYLLDVAIPSEQLAAISPEDLAAPVTDEHLRRRALHGMLTLEIVADPVPPDVSAQVAASATRW